MSVNGLDIGIVAGTGLLIYSGVTGRSPLDALKEVVTGKSPKAAPVSEGITPTTVISGTYTPGIGAGSGSIVSDALSYQGSPYVWGGSPGTQKGVDNGTDCSGFVNMVIGRDLGMAIPGVAAGGYDGASHGPNTVLWLVWGGCKTIPSSQAQAGDIACWQTHMGIFISSTDMISAQDPQLGVGTSPAVLNGEILVVRRYGG